MGAFLNRAGYESTHWSQVGLRDARDDELLRWAVEHDHIVLTSDLDFGAILAASKERRPNVVQLRSDVLAPGSVGARVLAALRQSDRELSDGALVSIEPTRARLRVLPLRE